MTHRVDNYRSNVSGDYLLPMQRGIGGRGVNPELLEVKRAGLCVGLHKGQGKGILLQKPISSHIEEGKHLSCVLSQ